MPKKNSRSYELNVMLKENIYSTLDLPVVARVKIQIW